jgi:hypothetical protein
MVGNNGTLAIVNSTLAFLTLAEAVSVRTRQFAKAEGGLPADLQSCKDMIEVLVRSCERISGHFAGPAAKGRESGHWADQRSDLESLLKQCEEITRSFLKILDDIDCSTFPFTKAWITVRREGQFERIRNDLHDRTMVMLTILAETSKVSTTEIQYAPLRVRL